MAPDSSPRNYIYKYFLVLHTRPFSRVQTGYRNSLPLFEHLITCTLRSLNHDDFIIYQSI